MAQLLIRNVDESVKQRLRARAQRHGKSMEEELRDIVRAAVETERDPSMGLGTWIASQFEGKGLDFEIEEIRGEPARPATDQNPAISAWIDRYSMIEIWTSSVSVMEVENGIERLPNGRRKDHLIKTWNNVLSVGLAGRVAPFDEEAAIVAGRLMAARSGSGITIDSRDTQIAGIALTRGATLATRNLRHFLELGTRAVDPCIPFGLLLTRAFGLGDIRNIGSGSIGATNVLRTGRKGLAAATLLLDALKGTAAVLIGGAIAGPPGILAGGLAAVLGHLFPVWLGFKGGKGVATGLGVLIAASPLTAGICAAIWLAMAFLTRISSASSLTATLAAPLVVWLLTGNTTLIVLAVIEPSRVLANEPHKVRLDRLRLARTSGIGRVLYRRLMQRFGDATSAIAALPGITGRAGAAAPRVPDIAEGEREIAALRKIGGRMLIMGDDDYPWLLALIADPPPVISILGDPAGLLLPSAALVGSRNASANGRTFAARLAEDLAARGHAVVSGMARGIDAAAHEGAMLAGVTIACVAGGLDHPYPAEHILLQARIAERGCVVAEAPLGTMPQARHFPRRNRIIAGLSLGVVVVEAALRSGSLITARLAQEAGRELFAVPGSPLDPRCHGTNALLRQGAHIVENAADILANLPDHPHRQGLSRDPMFAAIGPEPGLDEPQIALETSATALNTVISLLSPTPTLVDDLVRRCQLSAPEVQAALLDLELAGRVEAMPGSRFALLASGR
eukprot:gene10856-10936_t